MLFLTALLLSAFLLAAHAVGAATLHLSVILLPLLIWAASWVLILIAGAVVGVIVWRQRTSNAVRRFR